MRARILVLFILVLPLSLVLSCTKAPKKNETYQGHGAESVPPETLQKYSPSSLPSEVTSRIQNMLDVRAPGMGRISSEGKRLYFSWNVTGLSQVWRLDGPNSFPIQMTGGEDPTSIVGGTPDDRYLVISRDRKGEENPGLYLQRPDGGALSEIQHKKGVQTRYQGASEDSRFIYFTSNDEKPDSYTIYKYEIRSGKKQKIFGEPGIWYISDISRDQKKLLLGKATGALQTEIYEYDVIANKLFPLLGQGEAEHYSAYYGAKPSELLVHTNKFSDFYRVYSFKNKKFSPVTPEIKFEVDDMGVDYAKKRVYYTVNENGYTRLHVLDAKTYKPIALPKLPKADHTYIGGVSRDGRYATLGITTSKAPRTSYVLDWNTKKLTQWVLPSSPEVNATKFAEAKLEFYPAKDGTPIPMFVRRPPQCREPCPVIVYFHGGPESQSHPGFSTFAQMFVDNGYVFVSPNVRGSSGYGKTWIRSDNGPKRLDVISDIEDCALYIKKSWSVKGQAPQVGVMGYSYGGYATLMAMTKFAGRFDAGVALVGMSNLVTFLQNTAPYRRILRIAEYGHPQKDREALLKLSPVTYLSQVKSPLMIIQGASDPRVPVGEALQMHEALRSKGVASELIIFADEGHGSAKRDNRVLEIGHTIQFFNTYLRKAHARSQNPTP